MDGKRGILSGIASFVKGENDLNSSVRETEASDVVKRFNLGLGYCL